MPAPITVKPKQNAGITTTTGRIFLERRGSSTTLQWTNSPFAVNITTVNTQPQKPPAPARRLLEIARTVGTASRTIVHETIDNDRQAHAIIVETLARHDVATSISPLVVAYAYTAPTPVHDFARNDIYVLPVRYDSATQTIRLAQSSEPVMTFHGDALEHTLGTASHLAPAKFHDARAHGFASWIHDCDLQYGADHSRRRIAWLIGEIMLNETLEPLPCAILFRDLESDVGDPTAPP